MGYAQFYFPVTSCQFTLMQYLVFLTIQCHSGSMCIQNIMRRDISFCGGVTGSAFGTIGTSSRGEYSYTRKRRLGKGLVSRSDQG